MGNPKEFLESLAEITRDVERFPAASGDAILATEAAVGTLPPQLVEILSVSNGLTCRSFRLLSCFDESKPKKTWESIERGQRAIFDDDDESFLRFVCVADLNGGYAFLERGTGIVWYWHRDDPDALEETTLDLRGLIMGAVLGAE